MDYVDSTSHNHSDGDATRKHGIRFAGEDPAAGLLIITDPHGMRGFGDDMSQRTRLTLDALKMLDQGIITKVFEREVSYVTRDCDDRPLDDRPRKIAIEFSFTPEVNELGTGGLDSVSVQVQVQSSLPKRRSRSFKMQAHQDGSLSFHPELPEEPEGDALYDEDVIDRETGEVGKIKKA